MTVAITAAITAAALFMGAGECMPAAEPFTAAAPSSAGEAFMGAAPLRAAEALSLDGVSLLEGDARDVLAA
jgi:hypothetical protein